MSSTKSYQLTRTLLSVILLCCMAIGISGRAYVGSPQHHNHQNNTYSIKPAQHVPGSQSVFNQTWNSPSPSYVQHQQVHPVSNNSNIVSGQNAWQRPQQAPGGHRPIYNVATRHNNTVNWHQRAVDSPARPVNMNPYINLFN